MGSRLGVVTIGQAPRTDLTPELRAHLPATSVVEHGALDEIDDVDSAGLAPSDDTEVLVTRLRDGTPARIGRAAVEPLVERAIARAEDDNVAATLVVCTGTFGALRHQRPVLFAEPLLVHGTLGLTRGGTLGVISPDSGQQDAARAKWSPGEPLTDVAHPYTADAEWAVGEAANRLAQRGATCVVLDCMGYTEAMRDAARRRASLSVILARSLVGRLAGEIVA